MYIKIISLRFQSNLILLLSYLKSFILSKASFASEEWENSTNAYPLRGLIDMFFIDPNSLNNLSISLSLISQGNLLTNRLCELTLPEPPEDIIYYQNQNWKIKN